MKLVMLPIMASLAFIGFEHRSEIVDLYRAAYPADPVKREALEACARSDPNFNRLDTIDRNSCYANISARFPGAAASGPGVSDRRSPSQLPATDVRRQEATANYRRLAQAASASGVPVAPSGAPVASKAASPRPASRNGPNQ
jgi:hypothetical protein